MQQKKTERPARLIEGDGTIKHLNIRKEGTDDDKVLALDVKISGVICGVDLLVKLLGGDSAATVMMCFWDADGTRRFFGLDPVSSWASFEDCWVDISGVMLPVARVHKFKAELQDEWKASVEFAITVTDPPENAAAILCELVQDVVSVEVLKVQQELELSPAKPAELKADAQLALAEGGAS